MKELIRASMMVMGILVAIGCQKNMPEETEGAETMGVDPDGQTPPPSPKDVHGTVTASYAPMVDLGIYIYDCYGTLIDTVYYYFGLEHPSWSCNYDFCRKNLTTRGHPFPWHICAEAQGPYRQTYSACGEAIYSDDFTENNCMIIVHLRTEI
ncbi:MAG: hypothetical protein ABIM88_08085 [candidate division WOR-3 bacterium]